ncbi:MAG: PipX family protein [Trichodesmium sp. St16_bin4-tuft]|nr:PipX family protein [Trichodesmium sp. MAG_R01]MDE5074283.1 PipX family protein [Trichodesmium sp. St5_bin8]MDE5077484.1 PipX family protein [Trichodesmium sp. St2_bin6]MDE5090936.1 PipX family protein [Trichodesmium sp. St18_bin3_1_1]MDE5100838.1 PipX family protein [Trichodesmium sp. St16_bin4-tuft]MDE5104341.1 PipX family protein [Trichodesmium sp. St19_bin2]
MTNETYMNHPNFGLLYRVCLIENKKELFTTLYAQRLFFLVTNGIGGIKFEPVSRSDARLIVEVRLRQLRRDGQKADYQKLQQVHKNTFQ